MVSSSEFIKGYTEIIVCSLLFKEDDYIYNLVKKINNGIIQITNPSLLMIMKKLSADGKVKSYVKASGVGADRRYYSITDFGREFYIKNYKSYLNSLNSIKELIEEGSL